MSADFRRGPPPLLPLNILMSIVPTTDTFKFLRTKISRNLKWSTHHRLHPEEGSAESVLSETVEKAEPTTGAPGYLRHCHHPVCSPLLHHSLVWCCHQRKRAQSETNRSAENIIATDLLSITACTSPEQGHRQETSLTTARKQNTDSSNSFPLAEATEHCMSKQAGTRTVSFTRCCCEHFSRSDTQTTLSI